MYSIAHFSNTNDIAVVSTSWMHNRTDGKYCWWPPYLASNKLEKAVKEHEEVSNNWTSYAVLKVITTSGMQIYI